jgi:hypothetical protein
MRNYIADTEDKTVAIPTVADAERSLESLNSQLEAAMAQELELRDSEEELSIKAFDGDAKAKNSLGRLDADIHEIVTRQRMLRAGIKRGEVNLVEAKRIEAERIAFELAVAAREIAETQPAIGAALDKSLADFLENYQKLQEVIIDLERRGFGAGARHIGFYLTQYLSHVLFYAKIDTAGAAGSPPRGTTFKSIMSAQAGYVHKKTAVIIGDVVEPTPVAEVPAVALPEDGPCLTVEKSNKILDAWNAARSA